VNDLSRALDTIPLIIEGYEADESILDKDIASEPVSCIIVL
jgi:hypothetical protein